MSKIWSKVKAESYRAASWLYMENSGEEGESLPRNYVKPEIPEEADEEEIKSIKLRAYGSALVDGRKEVSLLTFIAGVGIAYALRPDAEDVAAHITNIGVPGLVVYASQRSFNKGVEYIKDAVEEDLDVQEVRQELKKKRRKQGLGMVVGMGTASNVVYELGDNPPQSVTDAVRRYALPAIVQTIAYGANYTAARLMHDEAHNIMYDGNSPENGNA